MAVMSNPSRAQFERFFVSGEVPTRGQPGSFAINLVDNLLWTFDPAGLPRLLGGNFGAHSPERSYPPGAGVVEGDTLFLSLAPVSPGPFNPTDWLPVLGTSASGRPVLT